jgi:hypothetical protein
MLPPLSQHLVEATRKQSRVHSFLRERLHDIFISTVLRHEINVQTWRTLRQMDDAVFALASVFELEAVGVVDGCVCS